MQETQVGTKRPAPSGDAESAALGQPAPNPVSSNLPTKRARGGWGHGLAAMRARSSGLGTPGGAKRDLNPMTPKSLADAVSVTPPASLASKSSFTSALSGSNDNKQRRSPVPYSSSTAASPKTENEAAAAAQCCDQSNGFGVSACQERERSNERAALVAEEEAKERAALQAMQTQQALHECTARLQDEEIQRNKALKRVAEIESLIAQHQASDDKEDPNFSWYKVVDSSIENACIRADSSVSRFPEYPVIDADRNITGAVSDSGTVGSTAKNCTDGELQVHQLSAKEELASLLRAGHVDKLEGFKDDTYAHGEQSQSYSLKLNKDRAVEGEQEEVIFDDEDVNALIRLGTGQICSRLVAFTASHSSLRSELDSLYIELAAIYSERLKTRLCTGVESKNTLAQEPGQMEYVGPPTAKMHKRVRVDFDTAQRIMAENRDVAQSAITFACEGMQNTPQQLNLSLSENNSQSMDSSLPFASVQDNRDYMTNLRVGAMLQGIVKSKIERKLRDRLTWYRKAANVHKQVSAGQLFAPGVLEGAPTTNGRELEQIKQPAPAVRPTRLRLRGDCKEGGGGRADSRVDSARMEDVIAQLHRIEKRDKGSSKTLAALPNMLTPSELIHCKFDNQCTVDPDPVRTLLSRRTCNVWSDEEEAIFFERYVAHGKHFSHISSYLPNKSTCDVIDFFYRNKKKPAFKKRIQQITKEKSKFFLFCKESDDAGTAKNKNHGMACTLQGFRDGGDVFKCVRSIAEQVQCKIEQLQKELKTIPQRKDNALNSLIHRFRVQSGQVQATDQSELDGKSLASNAVKDKDSLNTSGAFIRRGRRPGGSVAEWNEEDDAQLRELVAQFGRDWKHISKLMSKPQTHVKNNFARLAKFEKFPTARSARLRTSKEGSVNSSGSATQLTSTGSMANQDSSTTRHANVGSTSSAALSDSGYPIPSHDPQTNSHNGSLDMAAAATLAAAASMGLFGQQLGIDAGMAQIFQQAQATVNPSNPSQLHQPQFMFQQVQQLDSNSGGQNMQMMNELLALNMVLMQGAATAGQVPTNFLAQPGNSSRLEMSPSSMPFPLNCQGGPSLAGPFSTSAPFSVVQNQNPLREVTSTPRDVASSSAVGSGVFLNSTDAATPSYPFPNMPLHQSMLACSSTETPATISNANPLARSGSQNTEQHSTNPYSQQQLMMLAAAMQSPHIFGNSISAMTAATNDAPLQSTSATNDVKQESEEPTKNVSNT